MNDLISIAKIINFHGIKGEVKVAFTKGREEQIASVKKMYLQVNSTIKEFNIDTIRFHKNFAIIKFKELNSINDTELYKGNKLFISKDTVKKFLEKDEYLISDLEGLKVFDTENNFLGTICEIGENKAANLLCIKDAADKTHLVPFVKELVPIVDIKNKKVIVKNIEGLIN